MATMRIEELLSVLFSGLLQQKVLGFGAGLGFWGSRTALGVYKGFGGFEDGSHEGQANAAQES